MSGAPAARAPSLFSTWARFARVAPLASLYLLARWAGFVGIAAVERALPPSGRILDLGCGHGLLSLLAASGSAERRIVGLDRIESRLRVARRAGRVHRERLCFVVGDSLDAVKGPFDAVVIADVLFYMPRPAQRRLLERCAALLSPGGRLVVSEQTREPRWKARLVALQEGLVVGAKRALSRRTPWHRIAPSGTHLWDAEELARLLKELGLETDVSRADRFSYLSHTLFVGHAPAAPQSGTSDAPSDSAMTRIAASR